MVNKNDILTLDDNKDYCVVDTYEIDGKNYAFLFEVETPTNVLYTRIENDKLVTLDNEEEFKKLLDKIGESI